MPLFNEQQIQQLSSELIASAWALPCEQHGKESVHIDSLCRENDVVFFSRSLPPAFFDILKVIAAAFDAPAIRITPRLLLNHHSVHAFQTMSAAAAGKSDTSRVNGILYVDGSSSTFEELADVEMAQLKDRTFRGWNVPAGIALVIASRWPLGKDLNSIRPDVRKSNHTYRCQPYENMPGLPLISAAAYNLILELSDRA